MSTGTVPFCNYNFQHCGNVPRLDVLLMRGKLWGSLMFQSAEYPLLLRASYTVMYVAWLRYTNIMQAGFWKGHAVIDFSTSSYSNMFLNNPQQVAGPANSFRFSYDVGSTRYRKPGFSNSCVISIFQGHHGESLLSNLYDFVLPSKTFVESNSLFVNVFGFINRTNKAFSSALFRDSRVGWKISVLLAETLGISVPKSSSIIFKEFPVLSKKSYYVEDQHSIIRRHCIPKSHNSFSPYTGDPVSRNSRVLSMCHLFSRESISL